MSPSRPEKSGADVCTTRAKPNRKAKDKNAHLFFAVIDSKIQPRHAADLALNEVHVQGGGAC